MNAVLYNNALAVMSQRLLKHECSHQLVKVFRYETGEWDRYFKLVYLKRKPGETAASDTIENLRTVLERYRTLDLPQEIPACVFKTDIL